MNNIFRHIEYLILQHDCVIVPGFGAFIATVSPARIDRELGKIIPPCRSVMFNQSVTIDDGLLANSISRKENLSFEESRQVILKEVENLKKKLLSDMCVCIGGLGEIILGEEQNMLFQPSSIWSRGAQELGYHAVSLPTVKESRSSSLHLTSRFSKIAAAVVAITVIAIAAIINPLSPSDFREERASVVPVEVLVNPQKALSHNTVENSKASISTTEPFSAIENCSEKKSDPSDRFFLIVGTFETSDEAQRFADSNSTDEYHLITVPSRKVTRVALASSDVKEELLPMLKSKELAVRFPNSWIWSR